MVIGSTISHYRIVEKLGEGGMGVVYKAEDTKLERTVALKFLADHLLNDEDAKRRFLREAKAAAALHHPNVCPVHEIAEADGLTYLAMAFLEGTALEERIAPGPLPIKDALDIARQVAEGLEAAHEKGIIHRDIKPANIMVEAKGHATIMDFGLARLTEASRLTAKDAVMGTVAYMSPEQAQGREVDARTDVWALGCVLYEMVSGQRPFMGEYNEVLLYEICNEAPEPLTGIRSGVPMELEFIVGKCLAKDREDRPATAQEVARELRTLSDKLKSGRSKIVQKSPATGESPTTWGSPPLPADALAPDAVVVPRSRQRALQTVAAVATLAFLAVAAVHFTQAPPMPPPVVEFVADFPEGLTPTQLSLSPDGRHVIMWADSNENVPLLVRSLDSDGWRELAGTEGAQSPFWSPDSAEIGFFARGSLKKVALAGGSPETIAERAGGSTRGGSWAEGGTILFGGTTLGDWIMRVPDSGGTPIAVTESAGPGWRSPHFLPDGNHFLYVDSSPTSENAGIYLSSLDGGPQRRLLPNASDAVFAPSKPGGKTGFLLFVREDTLVAQPFDADRLELAGGPIALPVTPSRGVLGSFLFDASSAGVLAYSDSRSSSAVRLAWLDRTGATVEETGVEVDRLSHVRLSADGGRIAYTVPGEAGSSDVWVFDRERGTRTLVSNPPNNGRFPVWSPDGSQIAFYSGGNILVANADGSSDPTPILATEALEFPMDWSRNGRLLVFTTFSRRSFATTGNDIGYLELTSDEKAWEPKPFLSTAAQEHYARLSPNGRYLAYISDESGRYEVYVRPFPEGGRGPTVSSAGGRGPLWSKDGNELFYVDPDATLIAVGVSTAGEFSIRGATRLFRHPPLLGGLHDVSPDGGRFLLRLPVEQSGRPASGTASVRVIMNWPEKFGLLSNQ